MLPLELTPHTPPAHAGARGAVQDPKYRAFRGADYTTPMGLTDYPRPSI